MKWIPEIGDIFRLKGTEKPLYHLCGMTNYGMFSFVQEMENGIAGGEISEYSLLKNYELVENPNKLENVLNNAIIKTIMENKTRFEKFGNVMIDLETLSTHTNAAIIEIGAVEFNKHTGEVGEKFNVIIEPSDWCKNDRHVDGETIQWWFSQTDEARKRFVTKQKDIEYCTLKHALQKLRYFIMDCDTVDDDKNVVVWGNGSTMDITILESAYEYFDIEIPWKYWAVNDVRTIVDLNPTIKKNTKFNYGIQHSAVADCLYEIEYVSKTVKSLTDSNNLHVETSYDSLKEERKKNYNDFYKSLTSDERNNANIIYEQIEKDQGKYVYFTFLSENTRDAFYEGFLLTIVSSKEDYYYVYLDSKNNLRLISCLSDYKVIEDEEHVIPYNDKEISDMLFNKFETNGGDAIVYWGKYFVR